MKLHLYFARRFLQSFGLVFGVFLAITALLDMLEQIRKFAPSGAGLPDIVALTLLNVPQGLYGILPLVVILAAIVLFLGLARSSELVVTRAAGRSALRSLFAPVGVAALLGALAVAMFNPIVAATLKEYERFAESLDESGGSALSISREGLWLRQGDESLQTVIRASRANVDGTELYDVTFIEFSPASGPTRRLEAASARLEPGHWALTNIKIWNLDSDNPELQARTEPSLDLPSSLTQEQIRDSFGTPAAVAIWDLPGYIRQLEEAGFSARAYRVWLQMELAQPLMFAAMVLCAAGFTMRHTRFGRIGVMVLLAVAMGFTVFFLRNFTQILGENGQIPVPLAAWTPPVAAVLMSLGLLLHLEDG